jgi:ATP-dependent Clp protease adaptor protein ClpS
MGAPMEEDPKREGASLRAIEAKIREAWDKGHLVILWRDPVNLVSYIRLALRLTFRWTPPEIERHVTEMLQAGRSVLAHDTRERVEHYLYELRRFGLSATIERIQ